MDFTDDELKQAMRAFRKKLRATQLEEDSRLGRGPLSTDKAKITAILPPTGHRRDVWTELVRRGQLANDGGGFYRLAPGVH